MSNESHVDGRQHVRIVMCVSQVLSEHKSSTYLAVCRHRDNIGGQYRVYVNN